MNASDLGKQSLGIVASVAPTIATALGGPLAGAAVTFLEKALGMTTSTPQTLSAAITAATPEQQVALHKADLDFKAHMADIGVSEDQLAYADRANARAREIAVKDWVPPALAVVVTLGFFSVLGDMLVLGAKLKEAGDVILVMLGSLGTAWTGIIGYYFGSSAGSAAKTDALTKVATSPQ